MDRRVLLFFIVILFVASSFLLFVRFSSFNVKALTSDPVHNLDTGLNYTTIQEAIDSNETLDGHTILVEDGTYYENVVVSKEVSLIGENKNTTIIDGNGKAVVSLKSNGTKIKDFTVQNGHHGILMSPWTHSHIISNNILTNNERGISGHYDVVNVNICCNIIIFNNVTGINMLFSHSVISNNLISDNGKGEFQEYSSGIQISSGINSKIIYCENNTIFGNTIQNHRIGLWAIRYSEENLFFHNHFINNKKQISASTATWNNSMTKNYWSDYAGTDADNDGVGDIPYIIDNIVRDNHPLMGRFSDFNVTSELHVQTICNSSISDFRFNGTAILFNVTGVDGGAGFCRICIPKTLMGGAFRVFINGTRMPYTLLTEISNTTHNHLYFDYTHSIQEVIVIPEFPPFLFPPIFIIVTMLATLIHRKRKM